MRQKFYAWFVKRFYPYWCPYCPKRYRTESNFQAHYLLCEGRKLAKEMERKALEKIAPVNREQKRKMAKRAGQIKDWWKLNQ